MTLQQYLSSWKCCVHFHFILW